MNNVFLHVVPQISLLLLAASLRFINVDIRCHLTPHSSRQGKTFICREHWQTTAAVHTISLMWMDGDTFHTISLMRIDRDKVQMQLSSPLKVCPYHSLCFITVSIEVHQLESVLYHSYSLSFITLKKNSFQHSYSLLTSSLKTQTSDERWS